MIWSRNDFLVHPSVPQKLLDVPALICLFKKAFSEGNHQGKKEMCFSAQSKTLARRKHSSGEKGREREKVTKETLLFSNQPTSTFCHSFFLRFQTLFISCACFPFAAAKQHQAIYKHGCLLKWNLTSHQPLQRKSLKLYVTHTHTHLHTHRRNKMLSTIHLLI